MARRKAPTIADDILDRLLAGRDPQAALATGGLLDELKKALAERALNAEMDHHLERGRARADAAGPGAALDVIGAELFFHLPVRLLTQSPRDHLEVAPRLLRPSESCGAGSRMPRW